jgi:hypothetical protein
MERLHVVPRAQRQGDPENSLSRTSPAYNQRPLGRLCLPTVGLAPLVAFWSGSQAEPGSRPFRSSQDLATVPLMTVVCGSFALFPPTILWSEERSVY